MDIIYHLVTVLLSEYAQSPIRTKTPWKQAKHCVYREKTVYQWNMRGCSMDALQPSHGHPDPTDPT